MKLISKLRKNSFFASVFSIGSGKLIAQCISLITVPVLSRIYSTQAYGEYGILVSTVSIIVSFSSLGLGPAIMAPKDDEDAQRVLQTATAAALTVATLVAAVMLAVAPVYRFFSVGSSYFLGVVALYAYVVLDAVMVLLYTYVNRLGLNHILFVNPMIASAGNLLIALPLGLLGTGYMGFMLATILSTGIACAQMIMRTDAYRSRFSFSKAKAVIKTYKEYILFQCPANSVAIFGDQFPAQYLDRTFGSNALGIYSMCTKLLMYPARLVAQPISHVYFRTASSMHREGKSIADFTLKLVLSIMLIALAPMAIVIIWGKPLVAFALGEAWGDAGTLASILIYQYVLMFCSSCTSCCRISLGRQRLNLAYALMKLVLSVGLCVAGYLIFKDLMMTIAAYSFGRCFVQIVDMGLNFYCLKKHLLKYILFIVAYSGVVGFLLFFVAK